MDIETRGSDVKVNMGVSLSLFTHGDIFPSQLTSLQTVSIAAVSAVSRLHFYIVLPCRLPIMRHSRT